MTIRYRSLVIVLLAWMLICAAACGLILLETDLPLDQAPRRTRPPAGPVQTNPPAAIRPPGDPTA